jgi:hypothetical protein
MHAFSRNLIRARTAGSSGGFWRAGVFYATIRAIPLKRAPQPLAFARPLAKLSQFFWPNPIDVRVRSHMME